MLEWLYTHIFFWIGDLHAWAALASLIFLEIVLGIDNLIFLAILISQLEEHKRERARIFGLGLAMISRIALLIGLFWVMKLTKPLFSIYHLDISGRDIFLLLGGIFLLYKATSEIHTMGQESHSSEPKLKANAFILVLLQIMLLDIVFSLDSVITAVGMVDVLPVMVIAIVVSVFVMLFVSRGISHFIEKNPSIKVLALAFLLLIGITLIADGLHFHIPKGYIYFAIAFSLSVEGIKIYLSKARSR